MKFSNNQIYEYGQKLTIFSNNNSKMPVRINFYLQKNIQIITQAAEEIERTRLSLAAQYGTINETQTGYDIPNEYIETINRELNDLFSLEQELNIHQFKLEDFDSIELTYQELSAIMFMIEE
jgi:hypothetical protein